jgi:hypothetical protein
VRESMEVGTVYSNADAERERAIESIAPTLELGSRTGCRAE